MGMSRTTTIFTKPGTWYLWTAGGSEITQFQASHLPEGDLVRGQGYSIGHISKIYGKYGEIRIFRFLGFSTILVILIFILGVLGPGGI